MGALVLACGPAATGADRPHWTPVPARPAKADLEPLLATGPDRVVVVGTDADLAAVVLRLLRSGRLALPVGYVPVNPGSAVAASWRLPAGRAAAEALATGGAARSRPLVRDDSGGVLLAVAVTGPLRGEAYCDDQLALRGRARRIEVRPGPSGVRARVVHSGPLRRAERFEGRAFQIGCEPAQITVDGVAHPRPVRRWTWYRHTEDLRAIALPG